MSRLLATCVLLVLAPFAPAQERKPIVPFEGTQAFQHVLQFFKLEPVRSLDDLAERQPQETLVILFGRLDVLDELGERGWRLSRFLKAGGSALVASDYADDGRLEDLGVSVAGAPVEAPPSKAFRENMQCPMISPSELTNPTHPIFKGVKTGIATNRPSYLSWGPSWLTRLAAFPRGSRSDGFALLPSFAAGSAANAPPRDRVLVLAGHGVFVNGMMAQSDTDNFTFAWDCVKWLGERKKYALFVEDGKVRSDFNVPLSELPPIPIPPTRVINAVIRGIEEEGLFNRILHESVGRKEILQGVMIFLSVVMAFVVGLSLFKSRYRLDTRAPLVAPNLEKALSDVPVLSQRHRALLLQGNLFEAAQMLARLWFEKRTAHESYSEELPSLHVAGNWWQRRNLHKQVQSLWDIAQANQPREISRGRFQKLMDSVETLTAAYDRGVLRFA